MMVILISGIASVGESEAMGWTAREASHDRSGGGGGYLDFTTVDSAILQLVVSESYLARAAV